jgi:PAS domain S-box-containing protein
MREELHNAFPASRIEEVHEADGCLQQTTNNTFDVVITDITINGLNCFTLLRKVKERSPFCAVILRTTSGDEDLAVRAIKGGFADYIGKTGQHDVALVMAVRAALQREHMRLLLADDNAVYRELWDNAGDVIATISLDGVVTNVNRGAELLLGWSREEIIGQSVAKVSTLASVALADERQRRFLAGEKLPPVFEAELIRKDGSLVPVEARTRVMRDRQDHLIGFHGIYRDITERKRAAEQLREEAEINAALARVAQEMIASLNTSTILDRLCRIATEVLDCDCSHTTLWMPEANAYETVAGYGDTSEQWEIIRAIKVPLQLGEHMASRLLQDGSVFAIERVDSNRLFPDALMLQVGITSSLWIALRRGELVIGTLSASYRGRQGFNERQKRLAHGISQIASLALANARLLEELERSNRIKEDFVSTMSHELRTPLNIILGYNQLFQEETFGPLTAEQRDILERMQKNGQELLDLVNVTLNLSRLQSRRVPLEMHDVTVSVFMQELAAEIQRLKRNSGVQLEWSVASNLPTLRTDITKLKMVLKNLLTNALKFTESGMVSMHAEPRVSGIAFVVTDTGQGIAPEDLNVIFEPFRQGGTFTTRRQGGVGLGLYIVQQLLEVLGGKVTVRSELGKGSTFSVWLPSEKTASLHRNDPEMQDR